MKKTSFTVQLVTMAFLIALEIILTRFLSINLPITRIGFGFLPVAIMGILFGPAWAGIGYAVGDLLGMLLFPTAGAYFPGFTLTAFLTGVTYGLILHGKPVTWKRTTIAAVAVIVLYTLLLNTLWLNLMYGKGFLALMPPRLLQGAIMIPIQAILIHSVWVRVVSKLPFTTAIATK
ncbi:MAG: folate family ECF transporter S component [Anaerovoracaceae bacterium]